MALIGLLKARTHHDSTIPTMDSSTAGTLTQSIFTTIPDITTNLLRSWCLLCMRIVNHRRRLLKQEMQTNHTRHRIKEPPLIEVSNILEEEDNVYF